MLLLHTTDSCRALSWSFSRRQHMLASALSSSSFKSILPFTSAAATNRSFPNLCNVGEDRERKGVKSRGVSDGAIKPPTTNTTTAPKNLTTQSANSIGMGRVFIAGSGIGSDSSMIAANHRRDGQISHHPFSPSRLSSSSPSLPALSSLRCSLRLRYHNQHYHCPLNAHFYNSSFDRSIRSWFLSKSENIVGSRRFFFSSSLSTSLSFNYPYKPNHHNNQHQDFSSSSSGTAAATFNTEEGGGGGNVGGGGGGDSMDDEYGEMTSDGDTYRHPEPYELESGEVLQGAELRYRTYGTLNEQRDNVLVICHALTGNASLHSWWGDLLGPGNTFDTEKYFVVCANILGSCYGSTSPTSIVPSSSDQPPRKYGFDFPDVSVRDTVRLQLFMLRDSLKIRSVKCVIGGSFGGMQALEYAVQGGSIESDFSCDDSTGCAVPFVRSVVPIGCGATHTAWQIAISETQRQAIYADPKWNNGNIDFDDPPLNGLNVARMIAMVSYRTPVGYDKKFGREFQTHSTFHDEHEQQRQSKGHTFPAHPPYGRYAFWSVKSYLEYQGNKFLSRFDPVTYVKLTEQMDTHDVGRNRGGVSQALRNVSIPALVIGIDSDVLYPLYQQRELVDLLPSAELRIVESDAGHDGFLLEQDQVGGFIEEFLEQYD